MAHYSGTGDSYSLLVCFIQQLVLMSSDEGGKEDSLIDRDYLASQIIPFERTRRMHSTTCTTNFVESPSVRRSHALDLFCVFVL
jgi:hypothetical protein